jgi:hypothetical protein
MAPTAKWRYTRRLLLDSLPHTCHVCGESDFEPTGPRARTVDHLDPFGSLRSWSPELRIAHRECNRGRAWRLQARRARR